VYNDPSSFITDSEIIIHGHVVFSKYPKYKVIIANKSKSPVYFRGTPDLISCGIYNNEKIYHVTLNLDYSSDLLQMYGEPSNSDIETKVDSLKTKIFRERGIINNKNNAYEREKKLGILKGQYPEFCSDVHFLFFYAKNPYSIISYSNYVEIMMNDGYAVLGYHNKNKIYFEITDTDIQVNKDALNDVLSFVHILKGGAKEADT
jgi:hypothetical protein